MIYETDLDPEDDDLGNQVKFVIRCLETMTAALEISPQTMFTILGAAIASTTDENRSYFEFAYESQDAKTLRTFN